MRTGSTRGGATLRRTPSHPRTATAAAIGGVLAAGWMFVMLPNLRLPPPRDPLNYLRAAESFPRGLTDPDAPPGADVTHQVVRFGVTLPTRLAIEVFGYSQAAYYAVPVFAALMLLLSVYALGALLFSRAVGAAAAVLVLSATPIFREQSYLMPDLFSASLLTAAVALCVAVRLGRLPRRWPALVAIGVLLGWGYLVREFIVFGWPLAAGLLWRRGAWRDLAWVALPIAALFVAETALCWRLFDDPLLRLKVTTGHGNAPSAPGVAATYRDKPRIEYAVRLPQALARYEEGRWLLGLLVLTVVGGGVQFAARLWRLRDPATCILRGSAGQGVALSALWCAMFWAPLTFLGGVLDPSAPKLRLQLIRYWFPVFPAFVLGGLGVVWLAARWALSPAGRPRTRWLAGLVAVTAGIVPSVVSVHHLWGKASARAGGATHLEQFRDWMSRHEATPDGRAVRALWTDTGTDGVLRIYRAGPFGGRAWSARVRTWRPGGPQPGTGDLVLSFSARDDLLCSYCRKAMNRLMSERPPMMSPPLFATGDGQLLVYRVL